MLYASLLKQNVMFFLFEHERNSESRESGNNIKGRVDREWKWGGGGAVAGQPAGRPIRLNGAGRWQIGDME